MLLRGSSSRNARGSTPNRSSNRSRGQGSTSRGASSSSSTSSSGPNSPNPFDQERAENAAKRMQRGQNGAMVNGRGGRGGSRGGGQNNRSVRFAETPAEPKPDPFAVAAASPATTNPFAPKPMPDSSPFSSHNTSAFNPFAPKTTTNPFAPKATTNPLSFGSENAPPINPFASKSATTTTNPFAPKATTNPAPFGSENTPASNPFAPKPATNPSFSKPMTTSSPFGSQNGSPFNAFAPSVASPVAPKPKTTPSPFGSQKPFTPPASQTKSTPPLNSKAPNMHGTLAEKVRHILSKEKIFPPSWPTQVVVRHNDPTMIKLYNDYKAYRSQTRAALIRAGLLDDPDKPKRLSEALDFKGTCEDMCPDFEKVSRMMDLRIDPNEKEANLPSPKKMVKALARSAAGQDAPLPEDIRTAAALRRTVDHLFHQILDNHALPDVHGFLWDRTRAIRRDFVFHSSMTPTELVDQVYCLEHITRFHVTALHQMSKENLSSDKFSEQQELEQLGKTLLSLIHTYEDCRAQRVTCENEAEFRAYYVLFNSHDPGILDTVQTWGYKFWKESEDIKVAIELVEALQNTWELHGPLKPQSANNIAQNGFSRFFTIIENRKISYTLACFAEIFFNDVRKSVFKTILGSYRKQRDQTKDWTMAKLNTYLRFDTEEEVAPFIEAHGLRTDEIDGEEYLSFEITEISDPWPKLKQIHSIDIVERKKGGYSLPEVIGRTVFDESAPDDDMAEEAEEEEEEEGLFVKDDSMPAQSLSEPGTSLEEAQKAIKNSEVVPSPSADQPAPVQNTAPKSIFERMGSRIGSPAPFSNGFFTPTNTSNSQSASPKSEVSSIFGIKPTSEIPAPSTPAATTSSFFTSQSAKPAQSIFAQPPKEPTATTTPPLFSFTPPPALSGTGNVQQSPFSFTNPAPASGTAQEAKAAFFPAQQTSTTASPTLSAITQPVANVQPDSPLSGLSHLAKTDQPKTPFSHLSQPSAFSSTPQTPPSVPKLNEIPSQSSPSSAPGFVAQTFPPKPTVQDSIEKSAARDHKPLFGTQPPAPIDRSKGYDALSNWMALGEDGLIDQFTAFQVEEILRQTMQSFIEQEASRASQEADELARREADRFRYRSLATKYGYRWREMAHRLWLKRKGREARQVRREMAESMRASKAAQSAQSVNVVDDFKAATTRRRRESLESLLNATGVLNGVHDPKDEIRKILRSERVEPSNKRQRSERSSTSMASSTNRHKRGKSDNPLRRSLLSDPSYLNGDSRIHLMANYGPEEEARRHVSGVQTDYFRLKARGITTLPDGTPLASSVAKNIIHQKRSFDGIHKYSTPQSSKHQPVARSVPAKFAAHTQKLVNGDDREDLEAMKLRAKAFVSEEKSRQKRALVDDDEELFARAKRIREQMDEGAKWYRNEIERDTASRSIS